MRGDQEKRITSSSVILVNLVIVTSHWKKLLGPGMLSPLVLKIQKKLKPLKTIN